MAQLRTMPVKAMRYCFNCEREVLAVQSFNAYAQEFFYRCGRCNSDVTASVITERVTDADYPPVQEAA